MSAPSPAHRDVLAITGNITNTHTASMAMVVKPAAAAAAALYFMLRILRDRYPHLWSCIEPLLTPVLVAVCKGDRHPPSGPQAVCPTPGCHRVFRPRFPELRWDALHMHLKTCCPVLRGAICSTRRPRQELPGCAEAPADEGAPQRAALCRLRMWGALPAATSRAVSRYACPVVGCDLRFRHRWQCYHHFVATTNTSSTKGKDAHRQHWSQALLMCTARGSGHLSPAGQKGARREAARPTAAAVAKQLYSAAKSGNLGTVATILAASPKLNPNTGGEDGFTALMTAAEAGHSRVVARLLEHPRIRPNSKTVYGQTALAFAAQNGQLATVKKLLAAAAVDVLATTQGKTVAELARAAYQDTVADLLDAAIAAARTAAAAVAFSAADTAGPATPADSAEDDACCWGSADATAGDSWLRSVSLAADYERRTRPKWGGKQPRSKSAAPAVSTLARHNRPNIRSLPGARDGEPLRVFEQLRRAFLHRHGDAIMAELSPKTVLVPAPVSEAVATRFALVVLRGRMIPVAGYHGTPKGNYASIFETGLCNPYMHSTIRSNIPGVYSTMLGHAKISEGYNRSPDNKDVLVIGVADAPAANRSTRRAARLVARTVKPARQPRSGHGNHRDRHAPHWRSASVALATTAAARPQYWNDSNVISEGCGVRVIHDESMVAPLFIARGAYDYTANVGTGTAIRARPRFTKCGPPCRATAAWFGANINHGEQDARVGKGRVVRLGQVVWLQLASSSMADRRADAKQRSRDRACSRRQKP